MSHRWKSFRLELPLRFVKTALFTALTFAACKTSAARYYNDWATNFFSDLPSMAGPTNDPDADLEFNLGEFIFGNDPRVADGLSAVLIPRFGSLTGTNGLFVVELLEREGHQPGVFIDLLLSANLKTWIHPWWLRSSTNSQPGDPVGSAREVFTTHLAGTNIWFVRNTTQLIEAGVESAKYFVATNGSDSNAGTSMAAPFFTLTKAASLANPGDLIYVRDGEFKYSDASLLSSNGSPAQPIRVRAYPGEHPILNYSNEPSGRAGIQLSGNCWSLYGLEVTHAGHNGILVTGKTNTVERCVIHESGDTGLHITTGSYNLILNCDSYRNYDPGANGGNADGFSCKFIVGPGNVFRGCRSWNNSDDGWDLWRATNAIIVDHCLTFSNGFNVFGVSGFSGDGNGFKMGGDYQPGAHHFINCVSFGNRANGFDQNNNTAGLTLDNCTSWKNGSKNFQVNHNSTNAPMVGIHVLRNNLSIEAGSSDAFRAGSFLTNNSWQVLSPAPTTNELLSISAGLALAPRMDDGSLAETPFLRPIPGSRLVNRGTNVGQPFFGSAPDLGAYETPEW